MKTKINGSELQDAFHYALAACQGFSWNGWESSFTRECDRRLDIKKDKPASRSELMREAVRKAQSAGLKIKKTWLVRDAEKLAAEIDRQAREHGLHPNSGEPLAGHPY
jgi:hypothetical protein